MPDSSERRASREVDVTIQGDITPSEDYFVPDSSERRASREVDVTIQGDITPSEDYFVPDSSERLGLNTLKRNARMSSISCGCSPWGIGYVCHCTG